MNRRRNAFTLIELLLVLVILVVLATIVLPNMVGRSKKAKVDAARSQISLLETALGLYESDTGSFPTTSQGLQALVEQPAGVKGWKEGGYLGKNTVPNDPWGNPYVYVCPGQHNTNSFDLSSNGPPDSNGSITINNWDTNQ
ncbi:MAG: type II secretion system major pseudopilin GspG [Phycisphaerae bacterium]